MDGSGVLKFLSYSYGFGLDGSVNDTYFTLFYIFNETLGTFTDIVRFLFNDND